MNDYGVLVMGGGAVGRWRYRVQFFSRSSASCHLPGSCIWSLPSQKVRFLYEAEIADHQEQRVSSCVVEASLGFVL